jgi:uncharacterized protein
MERIFVDTSAWFAYVNRRDPDHAAVREVLRAAGTRFFTSNYVFDEIVTLCLYRLGHEAAVRVGRFLRDSPTVDVVRVTPEDETKAWTLFQARPDKRYSFTDCTSFELLKRSHVRRCLALDEDFRHEGFEVLP